MKIAIGCDPNAQAAKEEVIAYIAKKGYGEVTDLGTTCPEVFFVPSFVALWIYPPSPPVLRHSRVLAVKGASSPPRAACPLRLAPAVLFPEA